MQALEAIMKHYRGIKELSSHESWTCPSWAPAEEEFKFVSYETIWSFCGSIMKRKERACNRLIRYIGHFFLSRLFFSLFTCPARTELGGPKQKILRRYIECSGDRIGNCLKGDHIQSMYGVGVNSHGFRRKCGWPFTTMYKVWLELSIRRFFWTVRGLTGLLLA